MDVPLLAELFPEARRTGEALERAGLVVGVAESCTGGLLGAALTAVPGSSVYVAGGVIAYSDRVKREQLGVEAELLARVGAVSEEVAAAMAIGVRRLLHVDVGISVTGVAGPGVPGSGKPVGLVSVGAAGAGGIRVERLDGDRGREQNRARAVQTALAMCLELVARTGR